jgi:hypothetical protein
MENNKKVLTEEQLIKRREYQRAYLQKQRDDPEKRAKANERMRNYYSSHDEYKKKRHENYLLNADKVKEYNTHRKDYFSNYREENIEKCYERTKLWKEKNKEKTREYNKIYQMKKQELKNIIL